LSVYQESPCREISNVPFNPILVLDDDNPNPIQAQVLLFYRPPIDGDPSSSLKVLLLPWKTVLRKVLKERRRIHGEEIYIENHSCELIPNQQYALSTYPQNDYIKIQPNQAKFKDDYKGPNYVQTFEINLKQIFSCVSLLLRDTGNTSDAVWEYCVNLSDSVRRQQVQYSLSPAEDRLFSVRSRFITKISGPNLACILDKLLEQRVLSDCECELASGMNRKAQAMFVIDTVRKKGSNASSSMIHILCDIDQYLSEDLGLV